MIKKGDQLLRLMEKVCACFDLLNMKKQLEEMVVEYFNTSLKTIINFTAMNIKDFYKWVKARSKNNWLENIYEEIIEYWAV